MNEHKFDKKCEIYSKSRPGYPKELFEYLIKENIISSTTTAADIGSGTGIFTEKLAEHINTVYAIEPNDGMRKLAEEKYRIFKNIISVDGTAESTKLNENSIDFITVAQAFHWFDRQKFRNECRRILRESGKILLVWNDRDEKSELIGANYEINRRFCPNFNGSSNGIDFSREAFTDFFSNNFDIVEFRNDMIYDENTFISRSLSSSYAPNKGDCNYDSYVSELRRLFRENCNNDTVTYRYITRCYIGKV